MFAFNAPIQNAHGRTVDVYTPGFTLPFLSPQLPNGDDSTSDESGSSSEEEEEEEENDDDNAEEAAIAISLFDNSGTCNTSLRAAAATAVADCVSVADAVFTASLADAS